MQTRGQYQEWLSIVKDRAFRAGVPLRAELQGLVSDDAEDLGRMAEAERLGFNTSRLHPDVYMNELLSGMRIIHQALPAIMKKLGIDDFVLEESHLRNDAVLAGLSPDGCDSTRACEPVRQDKAQEGVEAAGETS